MTKGFLIAVCIIIAIALIIFPIVVSYKAQNNKKKMAYILNFFSSFKSFALFTIGVKICLESIKATIINE